MTLAEELRTVPVFADLPADDLGWLAAQMTPVDLAPGEILIREGAPADRMLILFEGEMRIRSESGNGDAVSRNFRGPIVGGMLPYSRMTHVPVTFRAVTQARGATFPADRFPELLARLPVLGPRLVGLLSDRIRDFTRLQDQQEKMAALGKISAGLAHELNNLLTVVQGHAERLCLKHQEDSALASNLKTIADATRRAAELVRNAPKPDLSPPTA